jgi:hypothetical protein
VEARCARVILWILISVSIRFSRQQHTSVFHLGNRLSWILSSGVMAAEVVSIRSLYEIRIRKRLYMNSGQINTSSCRTVDCLSSRRGSQFLHTICVAASRGPRVSRLHVPHARGASPIQPSQQTYMADFNFNLIIGVYQ